MNRIDKYVIQYTGELSLKNLKKYGNFKESVEGYSIDKGTSNFYISKSTGRVSFCSTCCWFQEDDLIPEFYNMVKDNIITVTKQKKYYYKYRIAKKNGKWWYDWGYFMSINDFKEYCKSGRYTEINKITKSEYEREML